jgi:hypothetical protein
MNGFYMARIRTIKPEFFTSEDIVNLSPLARLLYIALWCEADREGRLSWKPKTFKMRYFPADNLSIEKMCGEIADSGLIVQYGEYAFIPSFHAHQHINPRESASQLPAPDIDASTTRQARVSDTSPRDSDAQGGREGKGKEGNTSAAPDGVSTEVWSDFQKHRKTKKATITDTVMAGIKREADKAGWTLENALIESCARGWTGFNAEWVTGKQADTRGVMAGAI